jgi:CBS-domain-containing membrane protein
MKTWTVDDVMTTAVVSVPPTATYREVVDLLINHRFSAVPVTDDQGRVTGVVSEADLLRKIEYAVADQPRLFEGRRRRGARGKARGVTVAELMSGPAVVARRGTSIAAAARLMDTEAVKRLPVVDEQNHLAGIISRSDLLKVHLRPDDAILEDVTAGVLAAVMNEAGSTVEVIVTDGVVTLSGRVDRWSTMERLIRLIRQVAGVVDVGGDLEFDLDDRIPMMIAGVA